MGSKGKYHREGHGKPLSWFISHVDSVSCRWPLQSEDYFKLLFWVLGFPGMLKFIKIIFHAKLSTPVIFIEQSLEKWHNVDVCQYGGTHRS